MSSLSASEKQSVETEEKKSEAVTSTETVPEAETSVGAPDDAKTTTEAEPEPEANTPTAPEKKTATVQSVVEPAPQADDDDIDPDYKYAISVQDVHITYRSIIDPRANTIRHSLTQLGRKGNTGRKVKLIEAVRGISLNVEHGSILGIIGANGAGKSTLMRAMAGILPPTSGQIVVNGRISTLLALGVGFNGQLSGRDNVILGGLAAGLTRRQVNERFKDIADWAELDEFIDMPMKSYSSGMYGRLAFAVSTHLEPDVLLIDEALSTGDAHFRRKSYDKMQELVAQARTIVIVSHGIGAIREMCDDCIWIHKGQIVRHGAPDEVSAEYLEFQGVPPEPKKDETIDDAADFDDAMVMEDV